MDDGWVPLTMGNKIVGKAKIDLETGQMEAVLDKEFAHLLNESLARGVTEMIFAGRPGLPETRERAQKAFNEYLEREKGD